MSCTRARIRVPGTDLSNSIFDNSDFSDANLKDINFHNAWLRNTQFHKSCLLGVNFGEKLIIQHNVEISAIGLDWIMIIIYYG